MADGIDYRLEALRAAKAAEKAAKRRKANGHEPTGDWRDELVRNSQGKPAATLGNSVLALRSDPEWRGCFAWSDFANMPEIVRQLPGADAEGGPRAIRDADISLTTCWLNQQILLPVQSRTTAEAIRVAAADNHFHPVLAYLDSLAWDGTHRLAFWLHDHLGAADTDLHAAIGIKWMIGAVARVHQPGCQFDTALILESDQGLGKSTALRTLGGPWFTDHLPDLTSKDAMQALQGVWIVEIAELDSIRRAEASRIKSFLSSRIDRFRPPYGMALGVFPRQCVFGGTVNPGSNGYLRDETGARRFWTVACGEVWGERHKADMPGLAEIRDQLWAEAVHRYRAGEPWYLDTPELEMAQTEATEERQEDDPRDRRIAQYLQGLNNVHMADVLGPDCLQIPIEKWTKGLRTEVGFVLSGLKWRRKRVRLSDGRLEWRYSRS